MGIKIVFLTKIFQKQFFKGVPANPVKTLSLILNRQFQVLLKLKLRQIVEVYCFEILIYGGEKNCLERKYNSERKRAMCTSILEKICLHYFI